MRPFMKLLLVSAALCLLTGLGIARAQEAKTLPAPGEQEEVIVQDLSPQPELPEGGEGGEAGGTPIVIDPMPIDVPIPIAEPEGGNIDSTEGSTDDSEGTDGSTGGSGEAGSEVFVNGKGPVQIDEHTWQYGVDEDGNPMYVMAAREKQPTAIPTTTTAAVPRKGGKDSSKGGKKPCTCPRMFQPVCGIDGTVYPNSCTAKCAKKKVRFTCGTRKDCSTDCKASAGICACSKQYKPVCAKSGRLFNSPCLAQCKKDKVSFYCSSSNKSKCSTLCRRRASTNKKPRGA